MTNLTEKWKKGELPDGFYWCDVDIYEDGNITKQIESFIHHHPVFYWETSIVKVIELAPSFSEYKSMQAQNTKLKELLKECHLAIFDYPPYDLASDKIRLTNKIEDVLK